MLRPEAEVTGTAGGRGAQVPAGHSWSLPITLHEVRLNGLKIKQ